MDLSFEDAIRKVSKWVSSRSGSISKTVNGATKRTIKDVEVDFKFDLEFNDFRDWFLKEEDKPKQSGHKTLMEVYVDEIFLGSCMVPINFRHVQCKATFATDETIYLEKLRWYIKEMGMDRRAKFDTPKWIHPGDTVNFDAHFYLS